MKLTKLMVGAAAAVMVTGIVVGGGATAAFAAGTSSAPFACGTARTEGILLKDSGYHQITQSSSLGTSEEWHEDTGVIYHQVYKNYGYHTGNYVIKYNNPTVKTASCDN